MDKRKKRIIRPISITAVPGELVTVIIPAIELFNGKTIELCFSLYEEDLEVFRNNLQGNEIVNIQNGLGSAAAPAPVYAVENRIGNVLYSDKLFLGRLYRLAFGNNGPVAPDAAGLAHFLCYNSPCVSRPFDGANTGEQPEISE